MDYDNGQNINREAHQVAELLDRGFTGEASNRLRNDLSSLQNDPREQHEFLNRVNQLERKGVGADLQIQRGPDGREYWNIVPAEASYQGYPGQRQYPEYPVQPQQYGYQPQPYGYQPQPGYINPQYRIQPDPGSALVDGLAAGAGIAIGAAILGRAFGGGHNYYEQRGRYEHRR